MKSYLSLISISAKVRRKQNRMTLLCIIISVFLVTVVFSMADMMVRTETSRMLNKHGNWHIQLENISDEIASEIGQRSDVTATGWSSVFNINAEQPYFIGEKRAVLCGTDDSYIEQISNGLKEGKFPENEYEVMLGTNARDYLNLKIGDSVMLRTPAGDSEYTISGFGEDDPEYYQGQSYLVGVYMTREAFHHIVEQNGIDSIPSNFYVQFQSAKEAAKARTEIEQQYHLSDDTISENTGLMGMSGASRTESMKNMYSIAAVLFVLVLLAGVLMISGSMNSNISQRIKFFGMMRCIGASRQQIMRFVRLEALNWCKLGIPAGVLLGIVTSSGLCAILRYGIGGEFSTMPVFAVSIAGITSGILVGLVTVLLAAQSPARGAAKVSPAAAVLGGTQKQISVHHAAKKSLLKIESSLGVHHAMSSRKNWLLMTGSFALSIIMVLCFSVGMDFARALLPSLRSWQPDCTINGYANACTIEKSLVNEIGKIPGVSKVYGNTYLGDIPASSSQVPLDRVNMVSYDSYMLDCAAEDVVQGNISEIYGDNGKVMTICNKNNPLHVGDTIQIAGTEVEVACEISDGLFSDDMILICSEETFEHLLGEQKYTMLNVKLTNGATEETIKQISTFADNEEIFTDNRKSNQETTATYWATRIIGYGFMTIIAMITVFYIINSISMSVSARIRQYGVMRAVGMDDHQLTKMISAEAFTYAISGLIVGCAAGLPLSRLMYDVLITRHFGIAWHIPGTLIVVIILFVIASAFIAVYAPTKNIRNMAITETINEL